MPVAPHDFARVAAGRGYSWAPSWTPPPSQPPPPLFFYHVPKAGGISFWLALLHAFVRGWPASWPTRNMARLDEPPEAYAGAAFTGRADSGSFIFAATHNAFGLHRLFDAGMRLTTMVREPFGRVASHYAYHCMRARRPPAAQDFERFFRDPGNVNVMTRQLAGTPQGETAADAAQAISHLESAFESYVTVDDLPELLSRYLNRFGLPSVLMESLNRTPPAYRFDASAWRGEVLERNAADLALYRHIAAHPRLPPPSPQRDALNPRVLLIREAASTPKFLEHAEVCDTEALFADLARRSAARENSETGAKFS